MNDKGKWFQEDVRDKRYVCHTNKHLAWCKRYLNRSFRRKEKIIQRVINMKVISSGNTYEIFDDTLRVYEKLPAQNYIVRFSKFKGFYLDKYTDIQINEDKVYGVHTTKADKVLRTFANMNRSLGVILSGDKGIGKSLFAKLLAVKAKEQNIPLIVVDKYITGIASYLENIDQEVMVLFDEFDKTFGGITAKDGEANPQTELLSSFDGVSAGKKIICYYLQ